jgi:hypothetical protein
MPKKKKPDDTTWADPDDAPPLTDAFFDRAEIRRDGKVIQRSRPPLANRKQAVKSSIRRMG